MSFAAIGRHCLGRFLAFLLASTSLVFGQDQAWKFLLFADTRGTDLLFPINSGILSELAGAVVREKPAFVLFGGDYAFSTTFSDLQQWTNIMSPVYSGGIPIYHTLGNHEFDRTVFATMFSSTLPPPAVADTDFTYSFQFNNALILMLDQFVPTNQLRVNQAWLDAVLVTNTLPHVFSFGHVPAFKLVHPDCLGSYPTNRDLFWNALSNANARVYFCGHDHLYDHARVDDGDGVLANDIHQIIVGTGGGPLYADQAYDGTNSGWSPIRLYHEMQFGYETVEVNGDKVVCKWLRRTGPDAYEVADEYAYSVTPPPLLEFHYSAGGLTLNWPTNGILQAAPYAHGVFTNVAQVSPPLVITNFYPTQLYFRIRLP